MSKCPVCEAPVTADFGLIECEGCGVQLLVHVDGRVEHQGAEGKQVLGAQPDEEKPPAIDSFREVTRTGARPPSGEVFFEDQKSEANFEIERTIPPAPTGYDEDAANEATQMRTTDGAPERGSFADLLSDEAVSDEPAYEAAPPEDASGDAGEIGDLGDLFSGESPEAVAQQAEEELADFSTPEEAPAAEPEAPPAEYNFDDQGGGGEPAPPVYQSAAAPNSPDLSDVARFGNSDLSGGRDGALRYTLFIEGIDTADVRAAFREAITDRKFVWDIDTILRSVRNGEVKIQNVAPSKAYILISRLRSLPVKVRWEQYALSQT